MTKQKITALSKNLKAKEVPSADGVMVSSARIEISFYRVVCTRSRSS